MSATDSTPSPTTHASDDPSLRSATKRARTAAPDHQLPPGEGAFRRSGQGVGDLLRDLATDVGTLVRQEIELARLEITRTATGVAKDGAWIAVGAAIAAVGGLVLVVALALGLGALLGSYWLGTLITGVLLLLIGGLFAWKGLRDFRRRELAPTRTVATLREDADWARQEAEDFKQGIKE